jgi:hypothetical protein
MRALEKREDLLLKSDLPMMLLLVRDVLGHFVTLRLTYAERGIPGLPGK